MTDLINLDTESGRNIIGDDSTPTLTLENTSSGKQLELKNAAGTGVNLSTMSCPTTSLMIRGGEKGVEAITDDVAGTFSSGATEVNCLNLVHDTAIASPTVAVAKITASAASGAAFEFAGNCIVSCLSGGSIFAGVRVKWGNQYYWIALHDGIGDASAA